MNDMSKWDDLFGARGPDGYLPVDREAIVDWPITVETVIDEDGKQHIMVDRVSIMQVDREQVGLALEAVYATIRRMRSYTKEARP